MLKSLQICKNTILRKHCFIKNLFIIERAIVQESMVSENGHVVYQGDVVTYTGTTFL